MNDTWLICMDCETEHPRDPNWRFCPLCGGKLLDQAGWAELVDEDWADMRREADWLAERKAS